MKKLAILLGGTLLFVLLLGAGCKTEPQAKDAGTAPVKTEAKQEATEVTATVETTGGEQAQVEAVVEPVKTESTTTFMLTAEPGEKGTLKLKWVVPEDIAKDATAYRSLLSKNPNPEYPTKGWWYESGSTFREKNWTGLPSGKFHVRTCVVKNDACVAYSNDLEVEIK